MLKFARHHPSPTGGAPRRSSSVDRAATRLPVPSPTINITINKKKDNVTVSDSHRRSRTSSLERIPKRDNHTANGESAFTRGVTVLPTKTTERTLTVTSVGGVRTATIVTTSTTRASSPPPPLPHKSLIPTTAIKRDIPIVISPRPDTSMESNYEAIFSGTLCRGQVCSQSTDLKSTHEQLVSQLLKGGLKKDLYASNLLYEPRSEFHQNVVRLVEKLDLQLLDTSSESGYGSDQDSINNLANQVANQQLKDSEGCPPPLPRRGSRVRTPTPSNARGKKSVRFDSYVMLLQGLRERNLELVQTHIRDVCDEALATEEVINEFLTAVIEGNEPIIREMLANGFNVNASDPSGMTPLHLAATFNYLPLVRLLLSHGAAVFARTHSSGNIPSELSSRRLPGFQACHAYLRCMEECLGVANSSQVHVTQLYRTNRCDELGVNPGETLIVIRKGDYPGSSWWWCENSKGQQGYVLQDLLSLNKPTANVLK